MATPNSRTTFKNYCLRSLGFGVIDINVSDDQVDDRIDEALQYFAEYHYDGYERMYLKHLVTEADVTRARDNITTSVTDVGDGTTTADWLEGKNWIPVPNTVLSIVQVFPFTDTGGGSSNMFDVRYQLRLNDLYDFSSQSVIHYDMTMKHLDFLEHVLVGETPIRFNQHQNRLYIDMDWENDIDVDEFLIIECYRKLDPSSYIDVFDDIFLKRYAIQLIKRQWGANLSKFQGVQLLGGVEMNGADIYSQASEEILRLEEQIQLAYELPPDYMMG